MVIVKVYWLQAVALMKSESDLSNPSIFRKNEGRGHQLVGPTQLKDIEIIHVAKYFCKDLVVYMWKRLSTVMYQLGPKSMSL